MKKESIITLLLFASLIFNFKQYSLNDSLKFKVTDLGSSIAWLHETNMGLLEKISYRENLTDREIEDCVAFETFLQERIDFRPNTGSGGIYDVKILSSSLFANYAHARYSSWNMSYLQSYRNYIEFCY